MIPDRNGRETCLVGKQDLNDNLPPDNRLAGAPFRPLAGFTAFCLIPERRRVRLLKPHPALKTEGSQVRISSGEHGRKSGGLFFAAPTFARFFEMTMIANDLEGTLSIDLLLQPP
jgi:hypothetical protein